MKMILVINLFVVARDFQKQPATLSKPCAALLNDSARID
jgi:hypothetical protein